MLLHSVLEEKCEYRLPKKCVSCECTPRPHSSPQPLEMNNSEELQNVKFPRFSSYNVLCPHISMYDGFGSNSIK